MVAAVAITDAYSNDSPQFGTLVRKTDEGFTIDEVSADLAYLFHDVQLNRDEFMEHYYKRSNIDDPNAAIKRKFGETLKSKNLVAQVNELLTKIIAYNLTVVIHEMYENQINPAFLHIESG